MPQGSFFLRATALLSAGVLVVHELRYRLASGGHDDHALEAHGHSYVSIVAPVVALLVVVAAALVLQQAARGVSDARRRPFGRLWPVAAAALLVAFCAQELLEGALAVGHPAGVEGIFGGGGWIAAPLALLVGGAVAVVLRGADSALESAARLGTGLVRLVTPSCGPIVASVVGVIAPGSPLARQAAGRAPPPVCV